MSKYFGFPSYNRKKGLPYLFFSYKSEESGIAAKYARYVHNNGINVYYDDALEVAVNWEGELLEAIEDADCKGVIMMVSEASLKSPHVKNEACTANHCSKPILGVYIENVTADEQPMKTYLGGIQAVDAWSMTQEKALSEVLEGAKRIIQDSYAPAKAFSPADRLFTNASVFWRNFGMNKKQSDLERASEYYRRMTEDYPADYRGWLGLAQSECCRNFDSIDGAVGLLESAEDSYTYVVTAGCENRTKADFVRCKSELWERLLEHCRQLASQCSNSEELNVVAAKINGLSAHLEHTELEITSKHRRLAEGVAAKLSKMRSLEQAARRAEEEIHEYVYEIVNSEVVIKMCRKTSGIAAIPARIEGSLVTSIAPGAFGNKAIESVIIPDGVKIIGERAFYNCTELERVIVSGDVKEICKEAFAYCYSLKSINIPESVQSIGEEAFAYCDSLKGIDIPGNIQSIGEAAFICCESLKSINIPGSVKCIADRTFYSCTGLESVVVSEGVQEIGNDAFSECDSLKSIKIPESLQSIGERAFAECKRLESIKIPGSVKCIADLTFFGCTGMESVVISKGVQKIGVYAFGNCESLWSVKLPDGVQSIGEAAFRFCSDLRSINIPDSVQCIGFAAFNNCTNLIYVTLPEHLKENFGELAFRNTNIKDHQSKKKTASNLSLTIWGIVFYVGGAIILGFLNVRPDNYSLDAVFPFAPISTHIFAAIVGVIAVLLYFVLDYHRTLETLFYNIAVVVVQALIILLYMWRSVSVITILAQSVLYLIVVLITCLSASMNDEGKMYTHCLACKSRLSLSGYEVAVNCALSGGALLLISLALMASGWLRIVLFLIGYFLLGGIIINTQRNGNCSSDFLSW